MFENITGTHKPDILDCISNLSSDEVFTPPDVVNQVLDLLPSDVWSNPSLTWLDPACKSGSFLREVAKRLLFGLKDVIVDEEARREHVFKKMLFGISITQLTSLISRRSLYYSKDASSRYSVVSLPHSDGNIHYSRGKHHYIAKKCLICGAPEGSLDRGEHLENYAYQFIHTKRIQDIFDMKFDVIIGNPPYQLQDAGTSTGASPIYHLFVDKAKKLNPRYISMIIPSRWFAGGKGLDKFREEMLSDKRISHLVDYTDARECFPSVDIAGGICYFLWDRAHDGDCLVKTHHAGLSDTMKRMLNEYPSFIRYNKGVEILRKVSEKGLPSLSNKVSSRKPFGLATNIKPKEYGDLHLITNNSEGPFPRDEVLVGRDMIDKWNVVTSKVSYDHGGQPDKDGKRRVLSKVFILSPGQICSETYIVVGTFNSEVEARNAEKYIKTKFVRFLISLMSFSQDITKDRFRYVPDMPNYQDLNDADLYEYFKLTESECSYIESMIKDML